MALFQLTTLCKLCFYQVFLAGILWLTSARAFAQETGNSLGGRIVGYYASWNSVVLPYNKVEYSNLTDIIVAFGTPDQDGSISYDSGIPFPQLVAAAHAAGVRVLISLGGAGSGADFSAATKDSALRATLISNMISFLEANHYDGVDIDWETPSGSTDTQKLDSLIDEMRAQFNKVDSNWLVTMAIPATSYGGGDFDFVNLINNVDWFNVMCYDFVGSWSAYSGFNAPLYQVANDPNQAGSDSTAISYWLSRGTYYHNRQLVHVNIPKSKLVLGLPFYGDQFSAAGLYQKLTNSTVTNTRYQNIVNDLNSGWTYHWYDPTKEPYLINSSNTEFITYEDTNSVRCKAQFAMTDTLGGIMIWELSQDVLANGSQPLLETLGATMRGVTPVIQRPAIASQFKLYDNYPNPFNPGTAISYELSATGRISLTIYDVLGREVATLVNRVEQPGSYTVTFDASRLPSGVYFYRLQESGIGPSNSGIHSETKEMVLIK